MQLLQNATTKADCGFKRWVCKAHWQQVQACGYYQKPQNTRIKSSNSSAARGSVCMDSLIRLCAQTRQVPHEVAPIHKPQTPLVCDTHPVTRPPSTPAATCLTCRSLSLYTEENAPVASLQSFHGALGTEQ